MLISSGVTLFGTILTVIVTKWIEFRQQKHGRMDETSGQMALKRFDQEETIRVEMQRKIDRMDRTINRHERAFGQLRDAISDIIRETMMTMQLAMHDIRVGKPEQALIKLEEGVARLKTIKLPELPPLEEPKE